MKEKVLVIAAHPDDEVLGCGATIAMHSHKGDIVHILILAEGLTSRDDIRSLEIREDELSILAQTAKKASNLLGAQSCDLLNFPDNRMDSVDLLDVIKAIEKKIQIFQPSIVYTHFPGDLNLDHRITSQAVITACRPFPTQVVKEIYFFEVPSSTEWQINPTVGNFAPNYFITLNDENYMEKKIEALAIYESEMRDFPHPRSIQAIKSLASWRGATVGVHFAEAFMVGRIKK